MNRRRGAALREVASAACWLVRTSILFRLRGRAAVSRATARAIEVTPATAAQLAASGVEPARLLRAIRRAKRVWPARVMCLQTALALAGMLDERGVPARVRVGVRTEDGQVLAHAWVEVGDTTLNDGAPAGAYEAFADGAIAPQAAPR